MGLVPTMGALHEGHASLVDAAKEQCDRVVTSVFVNPTQFAAGEDLDAYPRDFDRDCGILEAHGCDLVFHPSVEEMYPEGAATFVELRSDMTKQLCGKSRPEHFCGVCTVVSKLFHIAMPDKAFSGKGCAAAGGYPSDDQRSAVWDRDRRMPDKAGRRRSCKIQPQCLP